MTEPTKQDRPFLRALKCAYKLHKHGADMLACRMYLAAAAEQLDKGVALPPASTPATDILSATFNFADKPAGISMAYWEDVQAGLTDQPS